MAENLPPEELPVLLWPRCCDAFLARLWLYVMLLRCLSRQSLTLSAATQNMALVKAVEDRAAQKGCTPGQLALAWVLARGNDVIPIPGTKRPNCFDENLAALKVKLTPEECTELENAVPQHEVRLSSLSRESRLLPAIACAASCSLIGNMRFLCLLMSASAAAIRLL